MNDDARLIQAILQGRRGCAQAITAPEMAHALGWAPESGERRIRLVIEAHANIDWEGVLCAIPGLGYFFAETIEEISTYRHYLRALSIAARDKLSRFDGAVEKSGFCLKGVEA